MDYEYTSDHHCRDILARRVRLLQARTLVLRRVAKGSVGQSPMSFVTFMSIVPLG